MMMCSSHADGLKPRWWLLSRTVDFKLEALEIAAHEQGFEGSRNTTIFAGSVVLETMRYIVYS